jgi:hypothetical protein
MVYGCSENEEEDVAKVFSEMNIILMPKENDVYRMGRKKPGKIRPVKVEFTNARDVESALTHARKLKDNSLSMVYLGPDRTKEERLAHNKLVKEMKQMIGKDPNKHHFICNKKICCASEGLYLLQPLLALNNLIGVLIM